MGENKGDHVKPRELIVHVLVVSYPAQGNVNPMLRLGKLLAAQGLLVTLSTTKGFGKLIRSANNIADGETNPVGRGFLRFEFFDDGFDHQDPRRNDLDSYMPQLELTGKASLIDLVKAQSDPVSCIVNNPFIPWACDVAEELGVPCATLWVQSCAVFASYYHFFHETVPFPSESDPFIEVSLPGMPVLEHDEIPTFLHPTALCRILGTVILGQLKNISKSFCVLADTYEELERGTMEEISKLCPVKPIGPLFKMANETNRGIRGDMMTSAGEGCVEWLNGRPASSVVYISFGTNVHLRQEQVEEIAAGLLSSGVSFLWVMKPPPKEFGLEPHTLPEGFAEAVGERGKVVKWSPQEEVLAHPAVSCFLTHCGWNSTVEALASGVPIVALPQWGDQVTNAKFLVEVFGVGVRLGRGELDGALLTREEVERCLLEATGGEKAAEMRRNAAAWKEAAGEAVAPGGSSDRNINEFVDEIRRRSREVTGLGL